ncbi:MAG: redoxin domain-containing protein [Chthonomonas sp.]|nr:redoxin domain-containing protein [Chthonomonas sp.]
MRLPYFAIPCSLVIAAGGFWLMHVSSSAKTAGASQYSIPSRHPVTKEMEAAAASLRRTPVPSFMLVDQDSNQVGTPNLKTGKPSVLFFIKEGCPCSIEAQPLFNNVAKAFGGDAHFFGVIDAEPKVASLYAQANVVTFPIICDPKKGLPTSFKMTASASIALVDGSGSIVKAWPGYNRDVLRQLNFLLGTLSKAGPKEFDDSDAPTELTAGCAFF